MAQPEQSDIQPAPIQAPGQNSSLIHAEVSHSIIGAAMAVLNELKPGLPERIYESALLVELRRRGHCIEQQRRFEVMYQGEPVGTLVPDLIVDGKVLVDAKVASEFTAAHIAQMMGYLAISGCRLALLLNFMYPDLRLKRVIR